MVAFQVLELHTQGADIRKILSEVAKSVTTNDVVVKKLSCIILQKYAVKIPDLSLLVINTFRKDCQDSNPAIRALAIRSLCSFPNASDVSEDAVNTGLQDDSAYVRRAAVIACMKLHEHLNISNNAEMIDRLYDLLRDSDPIVVANVLTVLEDVLKTEGGIAVNRSISHHLLKILGELTDWGVVKVFEVLLKYIPKTDDEAIEMMNVCDFCLQSCNLAIIVATINFFTHLTASLPHLRKHIFERAIGAFIFALSSRDYEILYFILCYLMTNIETCASLLTSRYKKLFCRYNEPVFIKCKKLQCLLYIANEENITEVVKELGLSCMDQSVVVSETAVTVLRDIHKKIASYKEKVLEIYFQFLDLNIDHLTLSILTAVQMWDFSIAESNHLRNFVLKISRNTNVLTTDKGKQAVCILLGEHGEKIEEAPYILEEIIDTSSGELCIESAFALLMAAAKLFLKRPPEFQDLLGRVMEMCANSSHVEVQRKTFLLYNLFKTDTDLDLAKLVLLNTTSTLPIEHCVCDDSGNVNEDKPSGSESKMCSRKESS